MIINRQMKSAYLQEKKKIRSPSGSGATKEDWDKDNQKPIVVAIFDYEFSKLNVNGVRYMQSTYTGLTKEKNIKNGIFRIIQDGVIYLVKDIKKHSKYTLLMLEEVETNV